MTAWDCSECNLFFPARNHSVKTCKKSVKMNRRTHRGCSLIFLDSGISSSMNHIEGQWFVHPIARFADTADARKAGTCGSLQRSSQVV